jgi:hypothetical protein
MTFPFLPGIPPLLTKVIPAVATLAAGTLADLLQSFAPVWGVFDEFGKQVLTPDTFLGIEYINSHRVSDYPLEKGSFAYYNKVQEPFSARVKVAKSGTETDRITFLNAIDALSKSLLLYTLITPEETYKSVSIERYDYLRETRNGAGIIIANIHFVEIRLAELQFSTASTVPAAQITNPTTTTGTASPTATVPQAQKAVHAGQIASTSAPTVAVKKYGGATGSYASGATGTW